MKKIIKGKLYNTATAKLIGGDSNGYPKTDFNYCYEELFLKKTGEFFIYGEGGSLSKYHEYNENVTSGGADIVPLSYGSAKQWAKKHLSVETYESVFGKIPEDDTTKQIMISMSASEAELLKRKAQEQGMTVSAYIVQKCLE